ncbi:MAG: putative DNA-directed RNA polymerase I subunit rpa1 [Streblomastix strix]|uniref:DNA-directed RNA polymerase n=1 Tax=Streblomastix strix TaxID=222440 RepID=A0A5J4VZQ0_9EUKA|nr:MAG: putative DNA-directed RNA polymerase I subunit rpa1 [Streblomastix strix]
MFHQISGVSFSFFTPSELNKLSVRKISIPSVVDTLQNPVDGGLYDPKLGPIDHKGILSYDNCPGHFGSVDLCVKAYNPFLFAYLMRILKAKCFCCHHFRMRRDQVCND